MNIAMHSPVKTTLALAISLATATADADNGVSTTIAATSSDPATTASVGPAATSETPAALDTVIVTGQKLERSLQDTKDSVVVLTQGDLENRNLTDLSSVIDQTPGLSGDQFGFRIRGVRSSDGASQPNRGDLASVVIDGVTTSGWVKSETIGQLWDIAQLEVLRGPQSTNLGRNALAGAIVVNTQDPLYANEGKVRLGIGNYGAREYKGVANINLIDGVSALRLSAEKSSSDGYIDNITRNEKDYGGNDNSVYRLKWLVEPNDDLRMVLSYQRLENEYGDSRVLLGEYEADDRISTNNDDARFETKADLASLNVDFRLNQHWSLKAISAYQDGERDRFNDVDQSPQGYGNGGGTVVRFSEDNNWSQELRLTYQSESVRGSSGVYYTQIEAVRNQQINNDLNLVPLFTDFAINNNIDPNLVGMLFNPIPGLTNEALYPEFYGTEQSGFTQVETRSWAAFTEWEIDFADAWTASFGARYDAESKDYETGSTTVTRDALPSTLPVPPAPPATPVNVYTQILTLNGIIDAANSELGAYARSIPTQDDSKDFSNVLPHAGLTYHWDSDTSGSFFVKKSYRSGGSELTLLNGINEFNEEELWNYELAFRSVLADGRGVLNANLYYSDWKDQQVAVQEPGTSNAAFTMTVNAGEATLYGAEVSFDYALTGTIDVYAGGAFSHTEYQTFEAADGSDDYSGNEFTFAPQHTAMAGITYQSYNGLFVNTTLNYQGESYSDVANQNELSARTLMNINGGYEWQNSKLELFVNNVFDRSYETNNSLQTSAGIPVVRMGAPRLIGARATFSF